MLADLQSRVESLESIGTFSATQSDIKEVQMAMLRSLRSIRSSMVDNAISGPSIASTKELNELKIENERLKMITEKQGYRISHLVRGVKELQKDKSL